MKDVLLISHSSGTSGGPVIKLYMYLKKNYAACNIEHPLYPYSQIQSIMQNGKTIKFKISPPLQFIFEGIVTLFYFKKYYNQYPKIDLAIGFDPLSYVDILIIKMFVPIKKAVYYNLDYSKHRFSNKIMNFIYQNLNKFAYQKSDYFFSLGNSMTEEIDPQKKYAYKAFVVKQTVSILKKVSKRRRNSIVFAGSIGHGANFEPLLQALKRLHTEGMNFIFDIYGIENDNGQLRKKIKTYGLSKKIFLKGPIDFEQLTHSKLPSYKIGVAPYMIKGDPQAPDHIFHGNDLMAKIVDYIAAGLPVVTTNLNLAFAKIENNQFGFLVKNSEEWYNAIKKLLTVNNIYNTYSKNALEYAQNYSEKKVFDPILKMVLDNN